MFDETILDNLYPRKDLTENGEHLHTYWTLYEDERGELRIHKLLKSGKRLHRHGVEMTSLILSGQYKEITDKSINQFNTNSVNHMPKFHRHMLEIDEPVWSVVAVKK